MCATPSRRTGSLAQQLLHVLGVCGCERHVVRQAAGLGARLVLKVVSPVSATAHHLAGAGETEPLLGAAVRLHLRHVAASLVPRALPRVLCPPADHMVRRAHLRSPAAGPSALGLGALGLGGAGLAVPPAGGPGFGAAGLAVPPADGPGLGDAGLAVPPADGPGLGDADLAVPPADGPGLGDADLAVPPADGPGLDGADLSVP